MKEIDFLPEWYRTGARRLNNYHTLYVATISVFLMIVASSFITSWSVSRARGQLNQMQNTYAAGSEVSREYAEVKDELARLTRQADILERLDSKIVVAHVLGELGFLTDKKIVLNKVGIRAEPFDDTTDNQHGLSKQVRPARPSGNKALLLEKDVRFKVLISGLAADAADVARLVRRLEESQYFRKVVPEMSRNKKMKHKQVSEFEISCYVANYEEVTCGS